MAAAAKAAERMTYEFDQAVLSTFSLEPAALSGIVLVRHARAGHRESFDGPDETRPLDAKGRRQAEALVGELGVFAPGAVHSAPLERCRGNGAAVGANPCRMSIRSSRWPRTPTGTIRPGHGAGWWNLPRAAPKGAQWSCAARAA